MWKASKAHWYGIATGSSSKDQAALAVALC